MTPNINFFKINFLGPTQNTPFWAPRKKFMCLISWERTQKGTHRNFFGGIFGVKKGVPNGPPVLLQTWMASERKPQPGRNCTGPEGPRRLFQTVLAFGPGGPETLLYMVTGFPTPDTILKEMVAILIFRKLDLSLHL